MKKGILYVPLADFLAKPETSVWTVYGLEQEGIFQLRHKDSPLAKFGTEYSFSLSGNTDPAQNDIPHLQLSITEAGAISEAHFVAKSSKNISLVIKEIPSKDNLFSRSKGLIEVDILHEKTVNIIGLGSFGSIVAVELAKAGLGHFNLFDFDRIELSNIARHSCGINDLGRLKTAAVKDCILLKNPYAQINCFNWDINNHLSEFKEKVKEADLTICVTDENRSRSNINQIVIELEKACLFGRAITRAEGGDVFIYRGDSSDACLSCVVGQGLFNYKNEEVSNLRQAKRDAPDYVPLDDVTATIQVGLSSDIAPMCQMIVKMALQNLSKGLESGLQSLDDDLIAQYYVWANRRESMFKTWKPMEYFANQPSVLRWYGARTKKDTTCPVCGPDCGNIDLLI